MCGMCGAGGELCRYESIMAGSTYESVEPNPISYSANVGEWYK